MLQFQAKKVSFIFLILAITFIPSTFGQRNFEQRQSTPSARRTSRLNDLKTELQKYPPEIIASFRQISAGAQKFSLEFLETFHEAYGKKAEYMISPFSIWSLLLLVVEGTDGRSLKQLRNALHIDEDMTSLRAAYRETQNFLSINTTTIEVGSLQALFTDLNAPIRPEYESIITLYYKALLYPINFQNAQQSYYIINNEVNKATRGLITHAVQASDLEDAHMILLSSLYFKGQWRSPFNKLYTHTEPFYDESGNVVTECQMMVQENNFSRIAIEELSGHVLELPYGNQNRLSMLIIMPNMGTPVSQVVKNLRSFGIAAIFERLEAAEEVYEGDELEVVMPRFQTHGDYSIPRVLANLGISDIFYPDSANFSRLSLRNEIHIKNILHSTKIVVDEKGTVAAAATTAVVINKTTPPRFVLNRPFLYLIIEKSTNLLLFAGQVLKPDSNF